MTQKHRFAVILYNKKDKKITKYYNTFDGAFNAYLNKREDENLKKIILIDRVKNNELINVELFRTEDDYKNYLKSLL